MFLQGLSVHNASVCLLGILANLFNRVRLPRGAVRVARSNAISCLLPPLQHVCPAAHAVVSATNAATLTQLTAYLSDLSRAEALRGAQGLHRALYVDAACPATLAREP